MITKETTIEELVENVQGAVKYLMEQGIRCIICGEPIWGTLEEAAKEKKFNDADIEKFVADLNIIAQNPQPENSNKPIINIDKMDLNKE